MLSVEDIKEIVMSTLYTRGIISKEYYLKCASPKYIQGLPGDLRTNDTDVLYERLEAIDDELTRREDILKKAEYRIGVKTRDSERLAKRVDKTIEAMDKAVSNIDSESDKIVKGINGLEDKLDKVEFEDSSLKKNIDNALKDFKESHNRLFDKDLTGNNLKEYKELVETYSNAGIKLHNILKEAYDNKLINKSDLGKADISKNITRIDKNIKKYEDNGVKINKDVQKIGDNQVDIDYITNESNAISKEMDILMDEFEKTNNKYMENSSSPQRDLSPNPQMIINLSSRDGDNFTFLPNNYESYMIEE